MTKREPPKRAVGLLEWALRGSLRDAVIGDLIEEFETAPHSALWFWRETMLATIRLGFRGRAATRAPRASLVSTMAQDLRYATRLLIRRPGFTSLAALTLAIGIGATTAIYSAIRPILLSPLPYPHPERLVQVWEGTNLADQDNVTFQTIDDVRNQNHSFTAIATYKGWSATFMGKGEPERIPGQRVSYDFFTVLGVKPALGRDFLPEDDVKNGPAVAIITDAVWRHRFGGDSSVIGRHVLLNGYDYTIIGVLPADFESIVNPLAQVWAPMQYALSDPYACRSCHHLNAIARLKPGVTASEATADLTTISARLVHDYPHEYAKVGMYAIPLHDQVTGGVRPVLLAVLGAVALVLAIACANVMNLLLARGAQRRGEFAMRAALGASSGRVVRQLLTESVALALVGGALGVIVAQLGVRALVALAPAGLPRVADIEVDGATLVFATALTTVVGIAFGLVPALHASRTDLHAAIKDGARRTGGSHRVRAALVMSEVALALMLLVGTGLLLRSVTRLLRVNPGFDAEHVMTMSAGTVGPQYNSDSDQRKYNDRVLVAVRAAPGVKDVALTSQLPLSGDFDKYGVHSKSHPRANPEEDPFAHRYAVTAGYIELMKIPLLRGRTLDDHDIATSAPVVVLNQEFAAKMFPGEEALGQQLRFGSATSGPWYTVVGIVGSVRQVTIDMGLTDAFYLTEAQWPFSDGGMSVVVRTAGDPTAVTNAVRTAIWSVDKDQPIKRVASLSALIEQTAANRRFTLTLFEAFALVALVLAAAGIYGVLAGVVTERLREIGVRSALGATRRDIVQLILRQGMGLTAAGMVAGVGLALVSVRVIAGMLYGVTGSDPATYAGVIAVLVGVALLACVVPAIRAARVDPVETLRAE